ncbi:NADAR family protein [Chitinophaga sancti]|uniref:NADAR family protein n=1 Tax=Chitinophaga sancti TaxID=1004 RepID=UPI003F78CF5E
MTNDNNIMTYDTNWLIAQQPTPKFCFFWKPEISEDGSITESCLGQWWVAPFTVNGKTYLTAEHWMMAGKATLFGDTEIEKKILASPSPATVKALGRKVANFDPAKWDAAKREIVRQGNIHKFTQHPELKAFLLSTGKDVLVEASPLDRIWGIGLSATNENAAHPEKWRGQNLLGYALMEVRDVLK